MLKSYRSKAPIVIKFEETYLSSTGLMFNIVC